MSFVFYLYEVYTIIKKYHYFIKSNNSHRILQFRLFFLVQARFPFLFLLPPSSLHLCKREAAHRASSLLSYTLLPLSRYKTFCISRKPSKTPPGVQYAH